MNLPVQTRFRRLRIRCLDFLHAGAARPVLSTWICVFLVLAAREVFARAGGGGGFGGGGGSSGGFSGGGGSGGGGSGGELIYFLVRLTITHPHIGIPLDIGVLVFVYFSYKNGRSYHVTRTIRKVYNKQDHYRTQRGLDKLRARDTAFSEEKFKERAGKAFGKIQKAWSEQDMKPVRGLISDGIFERFNAYLAMQKASLLVNRMEQVRVLKAEIAGVESDEFFDTVHLLITASAVDYMENRETGKRVHGKKQPETFQEYWSFLRRPGAKTLEKPGLVEGFCPNCGTPLSFSDKTVCESCSAVVNSGEYDWVLAEITQTGEWRGIRPRDIPGVDAVRGKDPAFNVQHLEDRASVMFWRLRQSEFFADKGYLAKLSHPDYLAENEKLFSPLEDGTHAFYADAAVGAVDLSSVAVSGEPGGMDRAHVKIRWSGHPEQEKIPSLMAPRYERSRIFQHSFILVRKTDTRSSDKNVLSSTHCPGCGAPETPTTAGECEYCGLRQNDGGADWVLRSIKPFVEDYQAICRKVEQVVEGGREEAAGMDHERSGIPVFTPEINRALLVCAISVMNADGTIDEKERAWLEKMGRRRNVPKNELDELVNAVRSGEVKPVLPDDLDQGRHFFNSMIQVCLVDGKVTNDERRLLKRLVSKLGYTEVDIGYMINRERARLYREARMQLKGKFRYEKA